MSQLFLVGRLVVGSFYLFSALNHFANTRALASMAAARGVPYATPLVLAGGVLLAIAGLSFLLGLMPRLGVLAAVLFLLPVTLLMHRFWIERNAAMHAMQMASFVKNAALIGSALMFLAVPEPWPYSVESALRRRERRGRREPLSVAP